MRDKVNMREKAIKSIDTLIDEGSRIEKITFERKWQEIVDPDEPWIAKREYAGYAEILIEFVPADKKGKK